MKRVRFFVKTDPRDAERGGGGRGDRRSFPVARGFEATIDNWKAKFGGLEVSEARQPPERDSESAKLKRLLSDTMLDNVALQALILKKW